ncbi:MAG: LysM peptidoglycan-binding domain-containing protein [Planctomycetota bacterium]|jgi:N-acetylmuramoyl-L-alanine amidase
MAHRAYKVKPGDTVSSIADKYGLFPEDVWNDSKNGKLKDERKDPDVLMAGDVVYVREKEEKEESCASEERHRFRRKGVPAELQLKLEDWGEPRAGVEYTLDVDGQLFQGKTDKDGSLKHWIPTEATEATLTVHATEERPEDEEYSLELGQLTPASDREGVASRLVNLAYLNEDDADSEDALTTAVKAFQEAHDLKATGQVDSGTEDEIRNAHGR